MSIRDQLWRRLSVRQQRILEGIFYVGCFTPLAFTVLAIMIAGKAVVEFGQRLVRR
jgi:hypothetical protein